MLFGNRYLGLGTRQKFECGPGPATPDRIVRVFLTCPCHRGGGAMKASTDSARPSECRSCEAQLSIRHHAMTIRNLAVGQQPFLCSEEQKGEEAATPGQPVAKARF